MGVIALYEQISLLDNDEFTEQVFTEKFDSSDVDNEREEDIEELKTVDLSDMAITGTDWTTETIITQIKKNNIVLDPEFQRRDAWTSRTKSRFIESLFLGLPIPQIILAEQHGKKGKFFVIDGKQRLLSLKQFVLGQKNSQENEQLKLNGLEIKTEFNKLTYFDIENGQFSNDIDAFNNQPIRTVVIKNWPSAEALYLIFLRLNTGSVKLSPQELRQALYPGDFIHYVNESSSKNDELKRMLKLKKPDFRMRDVEILIRYYAFKYFFESYSGSMQKFLDTTCRNLNSAWDNVKEQIETDYLELSNGINATFEIFGDDYAFRKYKSNKYEEKYNRSVIDIMLYYFTQPKIREAIAGHGSEIKNRFEKLCESDEIFLSSIEFTTKSISSVERRFCTWGVALSDLLGITIELPKIGHDA